MTDEETNNSWEEPTTLQDIKGKKSTQKEKVCKHVAHNSIEVLEMIIFIYIDIYSRLFSTVLPSFFKACWVEP